MIRFSATKVVFFLQFTKTHNKFAIIIHYCTSQWPALHGLSNPWASTIGAERGDGLPYLGGREVITFAKWLSCRHWARVIFFFSL